MSKFYITNAIPYVNAPPHIGHALEFIQSDTIARYHKLIGDDVALACGADENSLKNVQAAEAEGIPVQELVDRNSGLFFELWKRLGAQFDEIVRGSDPRHFASSQKLWQLCDEAGDIYKKSYQGLYCIGCEQFYELKELNENGECFEHTGGKLENIAEENYFFKLSKYENRIRELIEKDELKITPSFRKNEVLGFLKTGLKDISISRSNERARNWGVPVPGDNTQRMYVWFDALNIYQTAVGFGSDEQKYKKWWPADIHVIGKGIIRFHAIYWPAFLLSAGLELPKSLFVHDYITVDGQKMSKTVGNVIDPIDLIEKYGADAIRYFLLAKIPPFNDGDFSEGRFREVYNADLANGLGNLVARVAKLCERENFETPQTYKVWCADVDKALLEYKFNEALQAIWLLISDADQKVNVSEPWTLSGEELSKVLKDLVKRVQEIAYNLRPFLPETSEKILKQFSGKIKSAEPLFPRLV